MAHVWLTTSWDDGHILDERLADGLTKYGLTGTFYVARDYITPRLSEAQIHDLAQQHEVGAHTLSHPKLAALPISDVQREIVDSRDWLQQVTGKPITAFCYPSGAHSPAVRRIAAKAGFAVARTVEPYQFTVTDRFAMPTTLQVYPFPLRPVNSLRARFERLGQTIPYMVPLHLSLTALISWPRLAESLLRRALESGGMWHLWGHSWEIERYHMWPDLARVFAIMAEYVRDGTAHAVTNTQLARILFDDQAGPMAVTQPAPAPAPLFNQSGP